MPTPPTARLIAPPTSLASCVRAFVVRDTTGRPLLPEHERLNRFPASMLCSISWVIEGQTVLEDGQPMPRIAFGGPRTRPRTSSNPAAVRVFIALFFPQALHALTGMDISAHVDRFTPLSSALDGQWQALSEKVLAAGDDEARAACIAGFLQPRWDAARRRGAAPGAVLGDWVKSLGTHITAAGWGGSARNLERRIKVWAGQPLRTLRRLSRAELQFRESHAALEAGTLSWADAAAEAGYADQAHLSRETRAVTGLSPTELARRMRHDESYWLYRIWS